MFDSIPDFFNWLTLGSTGLVSDTITEIVNPADPYSKDHWLASFELAIAIATLGRARLRSPSPEIPKDKNIGRGEGAGNVSFTYDSKIAKQINNRGWSDNLVQNTLQNPHKTQVTRDTRYRPDGTRNNDPATAYIREDGSYVVRNDRTGEIVQVSNRNDPNWASPRD